MTIIINCLVNKVVLMCLSNFILKQGGCKLLRLTGAVAVYRVSSTKSEKGP